MTEYAGEAEQAEIVRDGWGIPHIRAGSAATAWFGMGYACASDRLFQLEYDRRRAAGRWAEVAGPAAVAGDLLARRMDLVAAAHADLAVMSPATRAMFGAYTRGVNAVIASGVRPAELAGRADVEIEPWEVWHSVAAYKVRHVLMGAWQHKLAEAVLLARMGPTAFAQLRLANPVGSPLSLPPGGRLSRLIEEAAGDLAAAAAHLGFLAEAEPGSNAWAVSGRRTAHGGAVLCNDSHRALDVPNVYWQCHLDCPDFHVTGAAFPGVPGFPHFGHNGQVAWAITHGAADTQDLYVERFDPARPGWYQTPDGWAEASRRTETIVVHGADPITADLWATGHGPVVHGDPLAGPAIALKFTALHRPGRGFEPLLPMLTAHDVRSLLDSQADWVDPVNNLLAADTGGHIGYLTRGELPVRSSAAHRRLPVPGWDGACEWTGTVPFGQLPRSEDPAAGFLMTANNVITGSDEPYVTFSFSQPFRAERLRQCLTATQQHTTEGLAALQGDLVSWPARAWAALLAGLDPLPDATAERARALLAGWDGELRADSAAALLYGCFLRALGEALYRPLLGGETWRWLLAARIASPDSLFRRWLANDVWRLLGGPVPPGAAGGDEDEAAERRVLAALPAALAAAWPAAEQAAAGGPWRWGGTHTLRGLHPLDPELAPPAVPMGGDADTLQASAWGWVPGTPFAVNLLPVYRQVVDLAAPQDASFVIPGGASGDPGSPHFADQLGEYTRHRRVPMLFAWPDVEAAAHSRLTVSDGSLTVAD